MICLMLLTDRRVADLGLGTAPFAFGDSTAADSVATVRAALNASVRLIDTALAYTRPMSSVRRAGDRDRAARRRRGRAAADRDHVTAAQLDEALTVAPVGAVQNRLSYADPRDLPTALACAERGVAYLAH